MKKIIFVSTTIFFICSGILLFNYLSINKTNDILYNDRTKISMNFKSNFNYVDFIKKVQEESKKTKVNVSQYVFLDEKSLNIYNSNIKYDKKIIIKQGRIPKFKTNEYIDNAYLTNNKNKVGNIKFPNSDLDVKYYNFSQLKNIGLGTIFYVSSTDNKSVQHILNLFKQYGDLKILDSGIKEEVSWDLRLIVLTCISAFFLLLSVSYYVIKQKYAFSIQMMLGYKKLSIILTPFKPIIIILLSTGIFLIFIFCCFFAFKNQTDYISLFVIVDFFIIICISFLISLYTILLSKFIYDRINILSSIKGKLPTKSLNISILLSKILISGIIFFLVGLFFNELEAYQQQLKNISYWNKAKNVYRLTVTNQLDIKDLSLDRKFNDQSLALYKVLKSQKNAFIMDASNYYPLEDKKNKTTYIYELNLKNNKPPYSPEGQSITVDENYLKVNPIKLEKGSNLHSKLSSNPNILNILVPEKYKKSEQQIRDLYRKEFYFEKVTVDNIYNKELNKPLNNSTKEELDVNIIYTKNHQKYFTFSNLMGSSYSNYYITDPIAIIYDNKIDSSYIGAYTTTNLYFIDDSKGSAYQNIEPYLKQTNANTFINYVESVYKGVNEDINYLKTQIKKLSFSMFLLLLVTLTLSINYIKLYYSNNSYKLYLKHLLGYSFIRKHAPIFINLLVINLLFTIVMTVYFSNVKLILFGLLITIFEFITAMFSSYYLNKKNVNKIIKGDNR